MYGLFFSQVRQPIQPTKSRGKCVQTSTNAGRENAKIYNAHAFRISDLKHVCSRNGETAGLICRRQMQMRWFVCDRSCMRSNALFYDKYLSTETNTADRDTQMNNKNPHKKKTLKYICECICAVCIRQMRARTQKHCKLTHTHAHTCATNWCMHVCVIMCGCSDFVRTCIHTHKYIRHKANTRALSWGEIYVCFWCTTRHILENRAHVNANTHIHTQPI